MSFLKSKEVKECICGKDSKTMIIRSDWDQTLSYLFGLAGLCLLIWIVASILAIHEEPINLQEVSAPVLILGGVTFYLLYYAYQKRKSGHSWRCALRQGFFKIT